MLIANESLWNTEDLTDLAETAVGIIGKPGYHWKHDTLLLFKTSRKRGRTVWMRGKSKKGRPPVAYAKTQDQEYHNTAVIYIASPAKLKMDVLDRMAHVSEHGRQDMSSADVMELAKVIARAMFGWRADASEYDWAANLSMRKRSKATKTKLGLQRKIAKLEADKIRLAEEFERQYVIIDQQIFDAEEALKAF